MGVLYQECRNSKTVSSRSLIQHPPGKHQVSAWIFTHSQYVHLIPIPSRHPLLNSIKQTTECLPAAKMAAECEAGLPPFSGIPPVCVSPDGTWAALSPQSTCISTYPCIPLPASQGICTPQPSNGLRGTDPGRKHSDLVLLPIKGQTLQMSVACGRLPSQLSTSRRRFPLCGHVMASAIPSQKWQSKCMCHKDDRLEQAASLNGPAWERSLPDVTRC